MRATLLLLLQAKGAVAAAQESSAQLSQQLAEVQAQQEEVAAQLQELQRQVQVAQVRRRPACHAAAAWPLAAVKATTAAFPCCRMPQHLLRPIMQPRHHCLAHRLSWRRT